VRLFYGRKFGTSFMSHPIIYRIRANHHCDAELEKAQLAARQLEEKMLRVEREREELEEARRSAEESRRHAEEAANLEKTERELKASATYSLCFCRAMLCISAAYAGMRCLSVCVSVCHVRELCQYE